MPGTIHVSVLNFAGSQSSSSSSPPPPQTSIKMSMGKKEYQTWDKGDFSFPLTSLRDNLIITLQDAEGNEISHAKVETRLVIEKGTWDDVFPLEGGGHVHMTLQFVLNDEDRQRIRNMRQSALRKKHDELLNGKPGSPEHSKAGRNVAASFKPNQEVSDRSKHQASATPSMQGFDVHLKTENCGSLAEKSEFGAYSSDIPLRNIRSESSLTGSSASVAAAKSEVLTKRKEGATTDLEHQSSFQRPPSNVKNMISAFESSMHRDMRPKIGMPTKPEPSKTGAEVPSKSSRLDNVKSVHMKTADSNSGGVRNSFQTGNATQATNLVKKKEQKVGSVNAGFKNAVKVVPKEFNIAEDKMSSEHFQRASMDESASFSGRMHDENLHKLSNEFTEKRLPDGILLKEISIKSTKKKVSQDLNIHGASGVEIYSEFSGPWIFPDEQNYLCITTGGKKVMNLIGGYQAAAKNQLGKMISVIGEDEKEFMKNGETDIKSNGGDKTSQTQRNAEADSADNENPRGLLGQVVRVAIMVGFATLVIFTRQTTSESKKMKFR